MSEQSINWIPNTNEIIGLRFLWFSSKSFVVTDKSAVESQQKFKNNKDSVLIT